MGKVTDITDAIVGVVETALGAGYTRLPNPYLANENAHVLLTKGYGVAIGTGTRLDREVCRIYYQRTYQIVLTKLVYSTLNNVDERADIDMAILEDFEAVFKALEANATLSSHAVTSRVESDSGIEFADSESLKFIMMTIDLTVEYQESY